MYYGDPSFDFRPLRTIPPPPFPPYNAPLMRGPFRNPPPRPFRGPPPPYMGFPRWHDRPPFPPHYPIRPSPFNRRFVRPKLKKQKIEVEKEADSSQLTIKNGEESPQVESCMENDDPCINQSFVSSNTNPEIIIEFDSSLPENLRKLLKPTVCELCKVQSKSLLQSKMHYEGKLHKKMVKKYMEELEKNNGEPPSKIPKIEKAKKNKSAPLDPEQLYCKCCDLSFTSNEHAKQHYLGRNHQRVLHGLKPLKSGYFNQQTGKWQRMPIDERISVTLIDSDFPGTDGLKPVIDPESVKERGRFYCDLCHVAATSQEQLDGHLKGARHQKALSMKDNKKTGDKKRGKKFWKKGGGVPWMYFKKKTKKSQTVVKTLIDFNQ